MKVTLACKDCGNEDLSFKVWVDKNFQIGGKNFISPDTDTWCADCGELVRYGAQVANEIKEQE